MLLGVAKLFFSMGLIAFGGPAAHIAMMHREVVAKRQWMDDEHFLDLVGATSLIPGPNSTEMAIHCGFHRAKIPGLIIAGLSFLLPATILTGLLAYLYVQASDIPHFQRYIIGVQPVVIIIIIQALKTLGKKAIKTNILGVVSVGVFAAALSPLSEILALFLVSFSAFSVISLLKSRQLNSIALTSIFWVFLKIGAILFGSGYVLIAYLQDELISQRGWITMTQLGDAIAFGQLTPGPVLSTATFIGYILGSWQGALLATIGIFLPSFVFVLCLNPVIPKMRESKSFGLLLDCINAGTVGLMAYALIPLSKIGLQSPSQVGILLITGLISYFMPKLSTIYLVAIGIAISSISTYLSF